jgi:hypothetical protein
MSANLSTTNVTNGRFDKSASFTRAKPGGPTVTSQKQRKAVNMSVLDERDPNEFNPYTSIETDFSMNKADRNKSMIELG